MRLSVLSALLGCGAWILIAQDSRFETESRIVLVPVTVTNGTGQFADSLRDADFRLFDSGRQRQLAVDTIGTGLPPIALAVAVETSGLAGAILDKVRRAGGLIQPLVVGDRGCVALFSFAERVEMLQGCTGAASLVEGSFARLQASEAERARLLDGAAAAIEHLRRQANHRRVLLLISENKDRQSVLALSTVTLAAQAAGVTIYAATYSAFQSAFLSKEGIRLPRLRNPLTAVPNPSGTVDGKPAAPWDPKLISPQDSADLKAVLRELSRLPQTDTTRVLAGETGGREIRFLREKGLEEVILSIGEELNAQYVLSFTPGQGPSGYHRLDVSLAGEKNQSLHVRARPGYWTGDPAELRR